MKALVDDLVDQQAQLDRHVETEDDAVGFDRQFGTGAGRREGHPQMGAEVADIAGKVHAGEVFGLVKLLVDDAERVDAAADVVKLLPDEWAGGLPRLQADQAGDDLEVVLDAVIDLLQQHFLFDDAGAERRIGLQQFLLPLAKSLRLLRSSWFWRWTSSTGSIGC